MRYVCITTFCLLLTIGSALADSWTPAAVSTGVCDLRGSARAGGKPEPNVVVWLDAPNAPRNRDAKPVVHQRNLKFYPRVLAVQVGSIIEFPNEDRVFHNVFSFHNGKRFDLGLYPTGTVRRVTLDRPGVSRLFCNIHPHMAAYIVAVATPYFAVSDDAGNFEIRGVPCGTYTYEAWRAGSSTLRDSVATGAEAPLEVQWP